MLAGQTADKRLNQSLAEAGVRVGRELAEVSWTPRGSAPPELCASADNRSQRARAWKPLDIGLLRNRRSTSGQAGCRCGRT